MSSTSEGPVRKTNKSETSENTLIEESVYRDAEEKIIEHLSSVFQKAEIGAYQDSQRAYARIHLSSVEELIKTIGFLDLLNISYWDDKEKLTLTIDNHFDIEALVEKGAIEISSLSDDEYHTIALSSSALYEQYGRRDALPNAVAIPLDHLKPIPEIFAHTTEDKRSEFDDMTEQKEGDAAKPFHGDTTYLYRQFSKKYRREPGRLFRKTKDGEVLITLEEQDALLAEAQRGNERARNEYLIMNMGLVYFTAFNMARLFTHVNQADMIQEGLIQMNKCIDGFTGIGRFSTYAVVSMEFRMLRYAQTSMREIHMPLHRQETIAKIQQLETRRASLYGTKLGAQEIAKELAISTYSARKLLQMKQEITDAEFLDITDEALEDEPAFTQSDSSIQMISQNELRSVAAEVIDSLTPREALIIRMRYGIDTDAEEMTLEEVGKRFDVTRERIRQIESKAMRKFKHPSRVSILRPYL